MLPLQLFCGYCHVNILLWHWVQGIQAAQEWAWKNKTAGMENFSVVKKSPLPLSVHLLNIQVELKKKKKTAWFQNLVSFQSLDALSVHCLICLEHIAFKSNASFAFFSPCITHSQLDAPLYKFIIYANILQIFLFWDSESLSSRSKGKISYYLSWCLMIKSCKMFLQH